MSKIEEKPVISITFKELSEKLKEYFNNHIDHFAFTRELKPEELTLKLKDDLYLSFKEVKQVGGEGEGDIWYSVKYFKALDMYVKIDGYYQSYNGTSFEDWDDAVSEVRPVEKTITVYE